MRPCPGFSPRRWANLCLAIVCVALAGCSQFPELDQTIGAQVQNAPYPELVPIKTLQDRIDDRQITPDTRATAKARIAALKARAARLKRVKFDSET